MYYAHKDPFAGTAPAHKKMPAQACPPDSIGQTTHLADTHTQRLTHPFNTIS